MPSTTIALSRVAELNVPLLWQEVVAVGRAAGTFALQSGQPISLAGLAVSTEGAVTATGSRHVLTTTDVFGLVGALLQGQPSPAELLALIASRDQAAGRERSPEIDPSRLLTQVEALGYFATPNPEVDIAALASRALEADADDRARDAIDRLRTDAVPPVPPRAPVQARRDARRRSASSKVLIGCAAALTLALAVVAGARYSGVWMAAGTGGADPAGAPVRASALVAETLSAAVQSMTSTLDTATDAALQKMGLVPAGDASVAAPAPPAPTERPRARRRPPANDVQPPPISAPVVAQGLEIAPAAALVGDGSDAVPPADVPEPDLAALDPGRVYTASDVLVEPPSLVYPQLPTLPLESAPDTAHLSLMVDELGQVVQARLVSTEATVGSRMLVFAAKTWRFSPATMEGRSVKYLLRVPVVP